jgi:hypothetical protein
MSETTHEDKLIVHVGTEHPHTNMLKFRVSLPHRPELTALLDDAGINYSEAIELSQTTDVLAVYAVSAGSLGGLAALLRALFERHGKNEFKVTLPGGVVVESKGQTQEEFERLLKIAAEAQKELDQKWEDVQARQKQRPELDN